MENAHIWQSYVFFKQGIATPCDYIFTKDIIARHDPTLGHTVAEFYSIRTELQLQSSFMQLLNSLHYAAVDSN